MLDGDDASKILEANRTFNGFEVTYNIKKELNNPYGRVNKEGIHWLISLN